MTAEKNKEEDNLKLIQYTMARSVVNLAQKLGIDVFDLTNEMRSEAIKRAKPIPPLNNSDESKTEGCLPLNSRYHSNQI